MTYVEHKDEVITINAYHCMALSNPHTELLKQYELALSRIVDMANEEIREKDLVQLDLFEESDHQNKNVVTLSFNNTSKNKLH